MKEAEKQKKCNINTTGISNLNSKDNPIVTDNNNNKINYFLPGAQQEAYNTTSTEIIQKVYKEFNNVFTGIGYFNDTFSFQTMPENKPYQPARQVAYGLQMLFIEELEWLQQQDVITALSIYEMVEWCDGFLLVPMPDGKVQLCFLPLWFNQAHMSSPWRFHLQ